ncbi:MAG: ferrous iron transport protein B [Candidatus Melainabacteria bacterium]|nr:ferrous iron transport protein B [Candidatus Melainabacteria bacterium]
MPELKTKTINIALVGNPNVGKSVIFNYLTGVYVDVSNYPGTTIEISSADLSVSDTEARDFGLEDYKLKLVDSPGVYGISTLNDEEIATRDCLDSANLIINVVSSISLSRDLFLTKQLADLGKPMLIVLNQCDEARIRKVEIDTKKLSQELGLDIIEAVAIDGEGLAELKQALLNAVQNKKAKLAQFKVGTISAEIDAQITQYYDEMPTRFEALLAAENSSDKAREDIYQIRREQVNDLVAKVVSQSKFSKRTLIGKLLLNPVIGSIAAIVILYTFLFQFLGIFVAGTVVDLLENSVFNAHFNPLITKLVSQILPVIKEPSGNLLFDNPSAAIGTMLAGDYGLLTLTITYLYGLLMPLVLGFYFGLAMLEDSGYLPRLAVLVDGILSKLGMNGRAIIPLILGGGCVTMATVTTRLLNNKKEKLITMALLGLTIPCSAQLGVIQGLLSNIGGITPWLIWAGTLTIVFIATGSILNKVLPGDCGQFISDIPPLRIPRLSNIFSKTIVRSKIFLDEATPAFFIAAAVVSFLQVTGLLSWIVEISEPVISQVLLLPKEVAISFILGMVRRDFGAFGLMDIPMSASQLVTACTVLTLFVPCIATVAVMIKEQNFKSAMAIWLSSWLLALGCGAILARIPLQIN